MGTQASSSVALDVGQLNDVGERHVHAFLTSFVQSYEAVGMDELPVVESARVAIERLECAWHGRRPHHRTPQPILRPSLRLVQ